MNITVLTYLDSEDENSKDYEAVVPQVARTLRSLGHRVSVLGAHGDVKRLIAGLSRRRPELVFNLMEMFGDNVFGDIPVTGLLDLLGLRYTGSGPGELYLSQDKGLTKKLLAFDVLLGQRRVVQLLPDGRHPLHQGHRVVHQGLAPDPERGVGPERLDEQRHPKVPAGLERALLL